MPAREEERHRVRGAVRQHTIRPEAEVRAAMGRGRHIGRGKAVAGGGTAGGVSGTG